MGIDCLFINLMFFKQKILNHKTIVNLSLLIIVVLFPHYLFKLIWARLEQNLKPSYLQYLFIYPIQLIPIGLNVLAYSLLYYFEFPIIERYRVSSDPWHWNKNPTLWKQQKQRLIWIYSRNVIFIAAPLALLISQIVSVRLDTASYPSL